MRTTIGIIGVGGVARYAHLPAYAKNGLLVSCLCDSDERVAEEVGRQFGIGKVYSSVDEMLAENAVDIVDVATPPMAHLDILERCVYWRKCVLMQKPIIVNPEQYARLSELIRRLPSFRVNLQGRFVSAWQKVKQLLDGGKLGTPLLCTISNQDWWDRKPGRWDLSVDGYIVFEMLIHHLDLCVFWFGYPSKVAARGGINPRQMMRNTNFVSVLLEYESGMVVQIVENWCMSEYKFSSGHPYEDVLITCSNGAIKANSECVESSMVGSNSVDTFLLPRPGQTLPCETLQHNWFFDAFGEIMKDYILNGHSPEVIEQDKSYALYITELLFRVYQSLKQDCWVVL
jgi:predicted dehydrogenase